MDAEQHWWLRLTDLFASAFRREVKTPLSFFFRIVWAVALLAAIAFFTFSKSAAGDASRLNLFYVAVITLGAMFLVVCLFAWCKPKNLVYGETGHRAEFKMHFGTEKSLISAEELASTPGLPNVPPSIAGRVEQS